MTSQQGSDSGDAALGVAAEVRAADERSPLGERYPLTTDERDALLASGHYRKSLGSPAHATHYRRSLRGGLCLHLVVEDDGAHLHRDGFDPHRDLVSLGSHLATEARSETAATLATAWFVVKLLAR